MESADLRVIGFLESTFFPAIVNSNKCNIWAGLSWANVCPTMEKPAISMGKWWNTTIQHQTLGYPWAHAYTILRILTLNSSHVKLSAKTQPESTAALRRVPGVPVAPLISEVSMKPQAPLELPSWGGLEKWDPFPLAASAVRGRPLCFRNLFIMFQRRTWEREEMHKAHSFTYQCQLSSSAFPLAT